MNDDLVKRLRGWRGYHQANLSVEAADRIEALTAERERLALAICGGERNMAFVGQAVETLERVAKQNQQAHGAPINSLLAAEAELDRLKLDVAQFRRVNDGLQDMLNKSKEVGFAFDNLAEVTAERDRLREALAPSEATKAAYMGEFHFSQTMIGDDGNDVIVKTYVPWTTVKEIMAAILARAALKGETP